MPKPEFDRPIPCPNCGESLTTVQVERVTVLEWNEESEKFEDNGQGGMTIRCYKCGKEIGHSDINQSSGIFPVSNET